MQALEGVQLDRLQRQHQRIVGVRAAQYRGLYLPPVLARYSSTAAPPPGLPHFIVPAAPLALQSTGLRGSKSLVAIELLEVQGVGLPL